MNGIDYVLVGDYYIPDLRLQGGERSIGKHGRIHRGYLRQNNPMLLNDSVLSCWIWTYLADTNEQAQEGLQVIISQMKKNERRGGIHNRVEEILLNEMIYR